MHHPEKVPRAQCGTSHSINLYTMFTDCYVQRGMRGKPLPPPEQSVEIRPDEFLWRVQHSGCLHLLTRIYYYTYESWPSPCFVQTTIRTRQPCIVTILVF